MCFRCFGARQKGRNIAWVREPQKVEQAKGWVGPLDIFVSFFVLSIMIKHLIFVSLRRLETPCAIAKAPAVPQWDLPTMRSNCDRCIVVP